MEGRIFLFLLLSGVCHFCSPAPHHHQYLYVQEPWKTWAEAQQYCRERYTDLVTIYDLEDMNSLTTLVYPHDVSPWIGLYKSWGWSLYDADDYKEGEEAYWNWASGEPSNIRGFCGSIGMTGRWNATSCSLKLQFFCYNESTTEILERFILVNLSMTWIEAQAYCREHHTNLARVRNRDENQLIQGLIKDSRAWIGLTRSSWKWSDGTEFTFRPWNVNQPVASKFTDCGLLQIYDQLAGIANSFCHDKRPFFCYHVSARKQVVRLKLSADSSVNLRDPAVMESILKTLEGKLRDQGITENIKLSWKVYKKEECTKSEKPGTLKGECDQYIP